MADTNVTVVEGDATKMPFPDAAFDGAVSLTMLHDVPSRELQDRLPGETFRVLKSGGVFAGSDSTPGLLWRPFHLFDTCVPVAPGTSGARLEAAGFTHVAVQRGRNHFRFRA
jgi:ubiquinone/menaquinone biosynthesis C-methylase UbiE